MREPTLSDASALAVLGRDSFVETFAHLYHPDDLASFLDSAYSVEATVADIADPDRIIRVVESDGQLVAYCKLALTPSLDFDLGGCDCLELKQLYLLSGQQGSGIAGQLMDWVKTVAIAQGKNRIVLSVWSGNAKAQHFYSKHGYRKIGETYFMVGTQRDDEFVFALDLEKDTL